MVVKEIMTILCDCVRVKMTRKSSLLHFDTESAQTMSLQPQETMHVCMHRKKAKELCELIYAVHLVISSLFLFYALHRSQTISRPGQYYFMSSVNKWRCLWAVFFFRSLGVWNGNSLHGDCKLQQTQHLSSSRASVRSCLLSFIHSTFHFSTYLDYFNIHVNIVCMYSSGAIMQNILFLLGLHLHYTYSSLAL